MRYTNIKTGVTVSVRDGKPMPSDWRREGGAPKKATEEPKDSFPAVPSEKWKLDALKEHASALGIDASDKKTKKDVLAMIDSLGFGGAPAEAGDGKTGEGDPGQGGDPDASGPADDAQGTAPSGE